MSKQTEFLALVAKVDTDIAALPKGASGAAAGPNATAEQKKALAASTLCTVYHTFKPILDGIKAVLGFFKPSWAAAITSVEAAIDGVCSIV